MKMHHPLQLLALLLLPFNLGFLLNGMPNDYRTLGHTQLSIIVLFLSACAGLATMVSLLFGKSVFSKE